jgi:hypothetical protein
MTQQQMGIILTCALGLTLQPAVADVAANDVRVAEQRLHLQSMKQQQMSLTPSSRST